jgi:hypothetical protein
MTLGTNGSDPQAVAEEARRLIASVRGALAQLEALIPQLVAAPEPVRVDIKIDAALPPGAPAAEDELGPVDARPASREELRERGFGAPLRLVGRPDVGEDDLLTANGLLATTGELLLQLDTQAASDIALGNPPSEDERELTDAKGGAAADFPTVLGDENNIAASRWAVVINGVEDTALLKALTPLILKRCEDQGLPAPALDDFRPGETCLQWLQRKGVDRNAPLKKSGLPVLIYMPGETAKAFLRRHGVENTLVDPSRGVPFYLLLAGRPGPTAPGDKAFIPFGVQYELDLFWGVGRLCFTDPQTGAHDLAAYTRYAEQVVAYERRARPTTSRHMVCFGVQNNLDLATKQSTEDLVTPLYQGIDGNDPIAQQLGFTQELWVGKQATAANLEQILRGKTGRGQPALLFAASHGLGYPADHPELARYQGALVCQDWPGSGAVKLEHVYAAERLSSETRVEGMIAFLFACYGAGCPQEDDFDFKNQQRKIIAPYPLVAQLPQQLLLNGALAVLGHVDRAWTHSFRIDGLAKQTQGFESVLGLLMKGDRAGLATDRFNAIQGSVAMSLTALLESSRQVRELDVPLSPDDLRKLGALWVARNDARNYALLGDPAVRLRFAEDTAA